MSGIFGIVRRDGAPIGAPTLSAMAEAMADRGRVRVWSEGCAALGQARTVSTPESRFEALPSHEQSAGFAITAAGRLDNREELLAQLAPRDRKGADGDLLL